MSGAKEELRKRQSTVRAACSAEESLTEVGATANHTRALQVQVHQRDYRVNNPVKDCCMRRGLPMQLSSLIFASISPCLPIFLSNKAFLTAAASYIPSCHCCIAQILAAMIYHHEHQNLDENCDPEMMLHCFLPQHNGKISVETKKIEQRMQRKQQHACKCQQQPQTSSQSSTIILTAHQSHMAPGWSL